MLQCSPSTAVVSRTTSAVNQAIAHGSASWLLLFGADFLAGYHLQQQHPHSAWPGDTIRAPKPSPASMQITANHASSLCPQRPTSTIRRALFLRPGAYRGLKPSSIMIGNSPVTAAPQPALPPRHRDHEPLKLPPPTPGTARLLLAAATNAGARRGGLCRCGSTGGGAGGVGGEGGDR